MMTCREVLDSLSSFIDEDVKQEVMQEMHRHIHVCSDCRAQFDSMTMTIKLYRHVDNPQMPAGCHDRLVKVLELERMKPLVQPGAPTPEPDTSSQPKDSPKGPSKGSIET